MFNCLLIIVLENIERMPGIVLCIQLHLEVLLDARKLTKEGHPILQMQLQ